MPRSHPRASNVPDQGCWAWNGGHWPSGLMGSGERAAGPRHGIPDSDRWLWHSYFSILLLLLLFAVLLRGVGKAWSSHERNSNNEDNFFPFRDKILGLVAHGSIRRTEIFTFIFPGLSKGRSQKEVSGTHGPLTLCPGPQLVRAPCGKEVFRTVGRPLQRGPRGEWLWLRRCPTICYTTTSQTLKCI